MGKGAEIVTVYSLIARWKLDQQFQNMKTIEPLGFKIKITYKNRPLISKVEVSSKHRVYRGKGWETLLTMVYHFYSQFSGA